MGRAKSSNSAANDARRQIIRSTISDAIKQNFSGTLGTQDDMVNIFLALSHLESSFNVNAVGPLVSESSSSGARDYWNSSVIVNIRTSGSQQQKENIISGKHAIGAVQIMGWNVVRGASVATGKCEIERLRPDLVGYLCVNAGDDIKAAYLGEANLPKAITAGLAILESKWKAAKKVPGGWQIGKYVFPLRISAAVAGYLGIGAKDVNGMTPTAYAASIVGGSHYLVANGASAPSIRDSQIQVASTSGNGPTITVASKDNLSVAGCIKNV